MGYPSHSASISFVMFGTEISWTRVSAIKTIEPTSLRTDYP